MAQKTRQRRGRGRGKGVPFWLIPAVLILIVLMAVGYWGGRYFARQAAPPVPSPKTALPVKPPPVPPPKPKPPVRADLPKKPEAGRPIRVAIVIDDLGPSLDTAEELVRLNREITLAVIPWQDRSKEILSLAQSKGVEVILHQPMEAHTRNGTRKLPGALWLSMTYAEIRETLRMNIAAYPGIRGVNNHTGSAFTEDRKAMSAVFDVLKAEGLYFLDSRTTEDSAGVDVAERRGVRVYGRDVFLDNESSHAYMMGQWKKFLRVARKRGMAVLIGHGRKESVEFLREQVPLLSREGIRLTRLSSLHPLNPES